MKHEYRVLYSWFLLLKVTTKNKFIFWSCDGTLKLSSHFLHEELLLKYAIK